MGCWPEDILFHYQNAGRHGPSTLHRSMRCSRCARCMVKQNGIWPWTNRNTWIWIVLCFCLLEGVDSCACREMPHLLCAHVIFFGFACVAPTSWARKVLCQLCYWIPTLKRSVLDFLWRRFRQIVISTLQISPQTQHLTFLIRGCGWDDDGNSTTRIRGKWSQPQQHHAITSTTGSDQHHFHQSLPFHLIISNNAIMSAVQSGAVSIVLMLVVASRFIIEFEHYSNNASSSLVLIHRLKKSRNTRHTMSKSTLRKMTNQRKSNSAVQNAHTCVPSTAHGSPSSAPSSFGLPSPPSYPRWRYRST
jgi:hypothetical protein